MSIGLGIDAVSLSIGDLRILDDISFDVAPGSLHALIGPNGAGKTSMINCISGFYRPTSGRIIAGDHDLVGRSPQRIARSGVARVFQNVELFASATTLDNVLLGRHRLMGGGMLSDLFAPSARRRREDAQRRRAEEIIDFVELGPYRHHRTGDLAYGLQKRVELARALAAEPELILLDEPVAGMNREEKEDMARFLTATRAEFNTTMLLVDHDMRFVMELADTVSVLDFGRHVVTGAPDAVQADPAVIAAYLGIEADATDEAVA